MERERRRAVLSALEEGNKGEARHMSAQKGLSAGSKKIWQESFCHYYFEMILLSPSDRVKDSQWDYLSMRSTAFKQFTMYFIPNYQYIYRFTYLSQYGD